MALGRPIHSKTRHRIVAREHHNLDAMVVRPIKRQQLPYKRKGNARVCWDLQPLALQPHIRPIVCLLKKPVFLFKIK